MRSGRYRRRRHLTKERRQIELRAGEGLFTVAHDAHAPLT